jgi:flagellar protein FliL
VSKKPAGEDAANKPKTGRLKKLILLGSSAVILVGGGIGAGVYASGAGLMRSAKSHEDPNRPKLVERSDEGEGASGSGEEGEGKEPAVKVGTVAVKSDRVPVDPKKYDVTYFPIEQSFTANLADGSGFVQVGVSLATYYDGRLIANLKRQSVPIRSAILLVLSNQEAAVLSTPQGKQMLQRELTKAINAVLRDHEGFGGIDNVYFTNLVIQ